MAKILLKVNNKAIATDGKLVMGAVEQVIPEGYIKPEGSIEITTTDEIDVSQYEKAQVVDANLAAENIVKDVTILGVTGTFEGGSDKPYIPQPSEMEETETQDTIYMLYDASGYMCCPAFMVEFTECVCTIQKYMNTTLVSEYVESVTSGTTNYLQFSEEDSDYSTYNYIVIKLQGNITKHYLNYKPKFNGVSYDTNGSSELLEVSGKCVGCDIKVVNTTSGPYHAKLRQYSFIGVTTTIMSYLFKGCGSLQTIILDTSNATDLRNLCDSCYSLQSIYLSDTSKVTTVYYIFNSCHSLQTIILDTSNLNTLERAFMSCYSLQSIYLSDASKVTATLNTFGKCGHLYKLDMPNIKVSFSLTNSPMLSQSELVKILNNLATVEETQTLTLGSTLLAKLTDEQKAIATAKGWTLA